MKPDFSKFDYKNLNDVQMGEIFDLAEMAMENALFTTTDKDGTHYFYIIPEGNKYDYYDGIRVEIRHEKFTPDKNDPILGIVSLFFPNVKAEVFHDVPYIHLHIRGKPEDEIITVSTM